ncbi:MAG: 4-hydroxy-tetrahydrodipicolinate synthase [Saprospiraceae bacterium]
MDNSWIKGVGTALVTPFDQDRIDVLSFKRIINYNIEEGVDFLVPLGTTGETSTLTDAECKSVLQHTLESNAGRVPVVNGMFGKNNTRLILDMIKAADFDGINAILVASPYYNKPSQAGLIAHFTAIADTSPVPLILYNVPSRTSVNLNAESTLVLAEHPNIIGTKEASGDFTHIMQILKYKPASFEMLSGDDPITLPMIACGSVGVISVISNAFPAQFTQMFDAAIQGDFNTAKKFNDLLLDVHKWLYIEGNPVGIKACLHIMGYCKDEVRLPLMSLSEKNKKELENSIRSLWSL